jgi:hypothetical protein
MFCFLVGLTKRLFLFQFFFLFAYLKFRDQSASSYEFKDKIYEFSTLVNFKHPAVEQFINNPLYAFQLFFGVMTVSAFLGFLGSRFFSFISAICLAIVNVLYFNPMRLNPATKKPELNLENFHFTQLPLEFIVLTVLVFALFAQAFRTKRASYSVDETPKVEEVIETRREPKNSSNKQKKRL